MKMIDRNELKSVRKTIENAKAQNLREYVAQAKKEFATSGLLFNKKPSATQFSTGGQAPRSKKEARSRAAKAMKHYLETLEKVDALQGNKKAMASEVSAAFCFRKMKVVARIEDVQIEGYEVEGPTVVFPVMHAGGSRAPKNPDDCFHWGWVERDHKRKEWFAEAWGVMFWSKSLREVVAFVYAQAIQEGLFVE